MEMRLILTRLLWNFDLELCPGCERWNEQKVLVFWVRPPLLIRLKHVLR